MQDQWQPRTNLTINYGLRWDAQLMPETIPGNTTAYGQFLNDPTFPSDGTIPDQWAMFQPRGGVAWDIKGDGNSVLRGSAGIYSARQNMLSQVGSVTTNGVQQQTLFTNTASLTDFGAPTPAWPGVLPVSPVRARPVPAVQRRPRLRPRLQEPAHLFVQPRLRAAADARLGRLRRLHLEQGDATSPGS